VNSSSDSEGWGRLLLLPGLLHVVTTNDFLAASNRTLTTEVASVLSLVIPCPFTLNVPPTLKSQYDCMTATDLPCGFIVRITSAQVQPAPTVTCSVGCCTRSHSGTEYRASGRCETRNDPPCYACFPVRPCVSHVPLHSFRICTTSFSLRGYTIRADRPGRHSCTKDRRAQELFGAGGGIRVGPTVPLQWIERYG
jgi:hypothetical protein